MTKVKAVIRKSAIDSRGECSVRIRLFKGNVTKEVTIPRSRIKPDDWDPVKCEVRSNQMLNFRIRHEIAQYEAVINKYEIMSKPYTLDDVVRASYREDSRNFERSYNPELLFSVFVEDHFIDTDLLAYGTRKNYRSFKKLMTQNFGKLRITDLNRELLDQLVCRLKKQNYSDWTIHSKVKYFKRILNLAIELGLLPPDKKLIYSVPKGQSYRKPLNQKELQMLLQFHPENEKDQYILKAFIFACFTGMRFGDVCVLKGVAFKQDPYTGEINLRYKMRKSGNTVELLLPNQAVNQIEQEIIQSDNLVFKLIKDSDLVKSSSILSQKIESANAYANKRLKIIMNKAGILRHFTFHESRYTFLCNGIDLGIDYLTLKDLGGLKSVDVLETHYAKVSNKTKKAAINRYNTL